MNIFKPIYWPFTFLLLWACVANGATYYVDVVAGDNANAGTSQGAAWKHVPGTVGQTGSGWVGLVNSDIVYVKGSTTNSVQVRYDTTHFTGAATTYDSIRIRSGHLLGTPWGSVRAIYDGGNTRTYGFWIGGDTALVGVTVEGFEIRNIAGGAIGPGFDLNSGSAGIAYGGSTDASYCKIRDCWVHDCVRTIDDTGHGIEGAHGHHVIVENCIIGPALGQKGIEFDGTDYGILRNNDVNSGADHGIVLARGTRWDVTGNLIRRPAVSLSDSSYAFKFADGQTFSDAWNNILLNDLVSLPASQGFSFDGVGTPVANNRFVLNTVYGFQNSGNDKWFGTAVNFRFPSSGTNLVSGNLLIKCSDADGNIQLYVSLNSQGQAITFNDLCHTTTVEDVWSRGSAQLGTAAQLNAAVFTAGTVAASNIQLDPMFVGGTFPTSLDSQYHPNTAYFSLTASSPLGVVATSNPIMGDSTHGYSSAINKFSTDILGKQRTRWSMGVYELQAAQPGRPIMLLIDD